MKVSTFLGAAAAMFLTLLSAFPARTAEFPYPKVGYSADVRMDMGKDPNGRPMILTGKVYFSGEKERRETVGFGHKTIIIWRRDKGLSWHLIPEQRMYMERRGSVDDQDPEGMMREGDVKVTKLGSETVNGMGATKYRIETTHEDGSRSVGHYWVTQDDVPVRMEGTSKNQHFRIDYTNIKTGNQDPRLFEVPAGYQRMAMPQIPGSPPTGMRGRGAMPQGQNPPPGMTQEQIEQMRKQMEEMMKNLPKQQGGGN